MDVHVFQIGEKTNKTVTFQCSKLTSCTYIYIYVYIYKWHVCPGLYNKNSSGSSRAWNGVEWSRLEWSGVEWRSGVG
jgi:hypothetical protein